MWLKEDIPTPDVRLSGLRGESLSGGGERGGAEEGAERHQAGDAGVGAAACPPTRPPAGNPLMYSLRYSWVGSYDAIGRECRFCQDVFAASTIWDSVAA
jgi:hypothetical protein